MHRDTSLPILARLGCVVPFCTCLSLSLSRSLPRCETSSDYLFHIAPQHLKMAARGVCRCGTTSTSSTMPASSTVASWRTRFLSSPPAWRRWRRLRKTRTTCSDLSRSYSSSHSSLCPPDPRKEGSGRQAQSVPGAIRTGLMVSQLGIPASLTSASGWEVGNHIVWAACLACSAGSWGQGQT